jgi:glycosyltransferase involved in cell wall biosynthesis
MGEKKRILMVSTSYPANPEDWRGRFIVDMAQALGQIQNHDLSLWAPPGEHPQYVKDAATQADREWLQSLMQQGGIANLLRKKNFTSLKFTIELLYRLYHTYRRSSPELVHVNWLQNAIPLLGTNIPALITVLGSDYGLLSKPGMVTLLRTVMRQRRTILAPNASWMEPKLNKLFGDIAKISTVPFGVDNRWFSIDRAYAEAGCWLAVTRITRNKIGDLFTWSEGLFEKRQLHLFGPMQEQFDLPSWVTWHGPTHPRELAETWFPKASGLITLSRHDEGRPQVMLEDMASGLPVIASDLPAHRDFIQHEKTGWIVNNSEDMLQALNSLENIDNNSLIGKAARSWIKQHIGDWDDCAARYSALYKELYI